MTSFNVAMSVMIYSSLISSNNPVKMSLVLGALGANIFILMMETTGTSWFPLIFFLLFLGGIIIMFLILSSILPNEAIFKIKSSKKIAVPMMILLVALNLEPSKIIMSSSMMQLIKMVMTDTVSFMFMVLIMLIYFFCMMFLIGSKEEPLRSQSCQDSGNFVNYLK